METDSYRIKNFDFFGEGETEFYDKFSIESVLIQGKHRETAPMVTVILPTYKRPDLLKQSWRVLLIRLSLMIIKSLL